MDIPNIKILWACPCPSSGIHCFENGLWIFYLPVKYFGKIRIHQALKKANWDIKKIVFPTDLGVPAFNKGSIAFATEDFDNGLGLMINGAQYVYVLGLVICPYLYIAIGALSSFKPAFSLLILPLFLAGSGFLLWRFLSKPTVGTCRT